jgi:hypothetical protein
VGASTHLRAIVIAGVLAAVALGLAFVTFSMNQTASRAQTKTILPLHARHTITSAVMVPSAPSKTPASKPKPKPKKKVVVDPNVKAAMNAGMPRSIAEQLAHHQVVVVQLTSDSDPVAEQTLGEAKDGAHLAGAGFYAVDVDSDSKTLQDLAKLVGKVPNAPATFLYARGASPAGALTGFVDRTVVQQAVANALAKLSADAPVPTPTAPSTTGSA